jgi:hypothetical protein
MSFNLSLSHVCYPSTFKSNPLFQVLVPSFSYFMNNHLLGIRLGIRGRYRMKLRLNYMNFLIM